MMNRLPLVSGLNVQALTRSFDNTTTSYKLAFFQALLNLCAERGFTDFDGKITCKDLAVEMAAFAWYPHTYHRLSFGRQDDLGNILNRLSFSVEGLALNSIKIKKKLRNELRIKYQEIHLESLLRYVPYRFLTPFFENELIRKPDQEKNYLIRQLADSTFCSESPPLYRLLENDTVMQIHPLWLEYIRETLGIINAWLSYHWISFLQSKNPNIPAISSKVQPPISRKPLSPQIKRWRQLIESSEIRCIYSDEVLSPQKFELDHFIPWSFVCHDQPWNLIPALPAANASKGSRLPNQKYMDKFVYSQAQALNFGKKRFSKRDWALLSEPYLADLRITEESLFSRDQLGKALNSILSPLLALAKQSGFSADWEYQEIFTTEIFYG